MKNMISTQTLVIMNKNYMAFIMLSIFVSGNMSNHLRPEMYQKKKQNKKQKETKTISINQSIYKLQKMLLMKHYHFQQTCVTGQRSTQSKDIKKVKIERKLNINTI